MPAGEGTGGSGAQGGSLSAGGTSGALPAIEAGGALAVIGGGGGEAASAGRRGCAFTKVPVPPAPVSKSASLEARAMAEQMATLDYLVGRYLRGDVPVYRGTMGAHDNASEIYPREQDGVIPNGPAIATLYEAPVVESDFNPQRSDASGRGAFLGLHGIGTGLAVFLFQTEREPGVTEVSWIDWVQAQHAARVACSGCVPSLWSHPAMIAFDEIDASGTQLDHSTGATSTAHVFVEADLAPADPCSFTYDELEAVSAGPNPDGASFGIAEFEPSGTHEVTLKVVGYLDVDDPGTGAAGAPGAGGSEGACEWQVFYAGEAYINLQDFSDYGVRDLKFEPPEQTCPV